MSLLSEISSHEQLRRAWEHIRKNKKVTPGIDEESVENFGTHLDINLTSISELLRTKKYTFNTVIQKSIPKVNSKKTRDIKIFTIKDKIVQKSMQISLEKNSRREGTYFPEIQNGVSVGFISNVPGVKIAVDKIKSSYANDFKVLTSVDIKDFFDVIDRKRLKKIINTRIHPDKSISWLLDQCLTLKLIEQDRYTNQKTEVPDTGTGVAQGSVLAPLFSNIYLMEFDLAVIKEKINVIRYADDIAILSKNTSDAAINLGLVKKILKQKTKLHFHPEGSKKGPKHYHLNDWAIYLGLRFEMKKELGWRIVPCEEKIKILKQKIIDTLKPQREMMLYQRINKINYSVHGWYSTYLSVGCNKKDLTDIYRQIKGVYEQYANLLLIKKGITKEFLTASKLNFIGVLSIKNVLK